VLVSSAGGVYAGSRYPPFNSSTPIKPISPYGQLKAAQESTAIALLSEFCPVTIARVSNVYGPGQNLKKLQGLVSLAILATYQRQPLSIFVPLETRRDYLYVDDLSNMLYSLCKRETVPEGQDSTEILASGRSWSVAEILRIVEEITRRRVPVALGSHASSEHQPLDMSFSPSIRLLHESTPFAVGVKRVAEDIMRRVQHGTIAN
jgi:UDP-glucose 4-epimerase